MFNWISLLYAVPMVAAMVIAGAIVGPRVNAAARTLLWTGIALLGVAQAAPLFTTYLVMERSLRGIYQVVNVVVFLVHAVGVVLLIVAIGRAARGNDPLRGGSGGYGYPATTGGLGSGFPGGSGTPGPTQPGYPHQPGQGYPPGQTGQPGYPSQPSGQPGYPPYGQPGQWDNGQLR